MKKLKILFSMICAIAIISSLCVPAFAYSDGDREVLYYNFNIGTGELVGCSSSSMKRLYNREWVVTVSSRSNNRYTITYTDVIRIRATKIGSFRKKYACTQRKSRRPRCGSRLSASEQLGYFAKKYV